MEKKAYFFSIDALIALAIILAIVLIIHPDAKQSMAEVHVQEDLLRVLSFLKTGEADNAYVNQLINQGKITNLNQSILEQIGEFYALGMPEANYLASEMLNSLNTKENVGLWFNNELIASRGQVIEEAEQIYTARQIISGLQKGESVKGFSSRAFLLSTNKVKYFYFGGYVGDGNISALINYNGNIKSAEIQAAFDKDFDLYINDNFISHYAVSDELTPIKISLSSYLDKFNEGDNKIEFKGDLYIAGGYIKISSQDSFSQDTKKYFPGIEGTINLYDSFYAPSNLDGMDIFLHYNSNYAIFLTIGNTTVYDKTPSGETSDTLTNSELSSMLNYAELSRKTVPIRFGLKQLQDTGGTGNADVVLITDLSGSMNYRMNYDAIGVTRNCTDSSLNNSDTKRISVARCIDKQVIDSILNVSGNRMALSGFYGDETYPFMGRVYEESLSTDANYLKSRVDAYSVQSGTCICCAINDAYKILNEQSNSNRTKFVIVMSDGIPTHTCQAASGCAGTRTGLPSEEGLWLGYGAGCYGGLDDCSVNDCQCASANANWSSCRVYDELDAKVYSIGFGPLVTCQMANNTLSNIAQCGRGTYYVSDNATLLQEFYSNISREITELSYTEQISVVSGNFSRTVLYPDSYIYLDYETELPYGQYIALETSDFGNEISQGILNIPQDSELYEANLVSYSGSKWTDNVTVNDTNIFSLAYYGSNYLNLGDPYVINLLKDKLVKGDNIIKVKTGISPANSSGGSVHDKIVYTLIKQMSSYSEIVSKAYGCIWHVQFELGDNSTMKIPSDYSGSENCYYTLNLVSYNNNDAVNNAVYRLLEKLDIDSDNLIDSRFSEQDMQVNSVEVTGIPFVWSTEVQARAWR